MKRTTNKKKLKNKKLKNESNRKALDSPTNTQRGFYPYKIESTPLTTILMYSGTDILNNTKAGDYMNESSRV